MKGIRPAANLGPANLFAVLTIIAFLTALPIALLMEGANAQAAWDKAIAGGQTPTGLAKTIAISGFSFYMYNEVSFLALDAVDPVTHAVGNTIKVRLLASSSCCCCSWPLSRTERPTRGRVCRAEGVERLLRLGGCAGGRQMRLASVRTLAQLHARRGHSAAAQQLRERALATWLASLAPVLTARPYRASRPPRRLPACPAARHPHPAQRGRVWHQDDRPQRGRLNDRHHRRVRLLDCTCRIQPRLTLPQLRTSASALDPALAGRRQTQRETTYTGLTQSTFRAVAPGCVPPVPFAQAKAKIPAKKKAA